jgi:hypothetical protein
MQPMEHGPQLSLLAYTFAGIAESRSSAIIRGTGLHQTGIEAVLADQQAELVAWAKLPILVAAVSIGL